MTNEAILSSNGNYTLFSFNVLSDSELHQNSKDIQKYLNGKTVILQ